MPQFYPSTARPSTEHDPDVCGIDADSSCVACRRAWGWREPESAEAAAARIAHADYTRRIDNAWTALLPRVDARIVDALAAWTRRAAS